MSKKLKTWLILSIVFAVGGAVMLFPIGGEAANTIFVLVKVGMVTGLIILLASQKIGGYCTWATCSILAIVMTAIKWAGGGKQYFLYVLSMIVDIAMPLVAYRIMKKDGMLKKNLPGA